MLLRIRTHTHIPRKPVAHNYELLSRNWELLWGIVACLFGLLGFPGRAWGLGQVDCLEASIGDNNPV